MRIFSLETFESHWDNRGVGWLDFEKRAQFAGERRIVFERIILGVGFEKEIEGIEDRHFRDQIHFHEKLAGGFGEDQASEIVGLRILLPVDEVVFRLDFE